MKIISNLIKRLSHSFCIVVVYCLFLQPSSLLSDACDDAEKLMNALMIVNYWNDRINDRMPVTYNHLLQGGYFNMPSSRMGNEGEIGFGYTYLPPYRIYSLRCQLTDRLEVSGNYRIFHGVPDPVLTPLGFGDLSDKGANFKFAIFHPEESNYQLPGLAIGSEDIMGTRSFKSVYIVLTQVFLNYDLEASLGYGGGRIRGFFGGINWMPFRRSCPAFLQNLCLTAEYDAIPYKDPEIEKHPDGRKSKTPINFGMKYRFWENFDLALSYIRGRELAFSLSGFYNFGMTKGFLPKIDDPLPYNAPINLEPIGEKRPDDVFASELHFAFEAQGFDVLEAALSYNACEERVLRLKVYNTCYRVEREVRRQITQLLACLIPLDIDYVIVVIEDEGFPVHEYHFCMMYVRQYAQHEISYPELTILSPLSPVSFPSPDTLCYLFKQRRDLFNFALLPRTYTLFGSSRGKFKYSIGLTAAVNGYLFDDVYYSFRVGYPFASDLEHLTGIDRLNPSQLPNVRTDIVKYFKQQEVSVDEAYVQKNWNLGCGWYSKFALGYFEEEYAGVASEWLYYPTYSNWAIGIEGACFKKRTFTGLGFTDKVRQLQGFKPFYRHFNFSQYFADFYYEWPEARLDFKVMLGKFLADDYGARFELARYFPSGLKITLWYTYTNGHDKINGSTYYDKGISFSMPIDIFYTYSDRSRWSYGMSAWLRDVGVTAETGLKLYDLIREQRNY